MDSIFPLLKTFLIRFFCEINDWYSCGDYSYLFNASNIWDIQDIINGKNLYFVPLPGHTPLSQKNFHSIKDYDTYQDICSNPSNYFKKHNINNILTIKPTIIFYKNIYDSKYTYVYTSSSICILVTETLESNKFDFLKYLNILNNKQNNNYLLGYDINNFI